MTYDHPVSPNHGVPAPEVQQPESFAFTAENQARVADILKRYPADRQDSAVLPLLDLAQRQHDNWLPVAAMDHVAEVLGMAKIRVYEVASFYTMLNKTPVARHFVQICRTTPCWLTGSDEVTRAIKDATGVAPGETKGDFTVVEVECLGACCNAPMVQVNDDYYEDLDYDRTLALFEALKRGETPRPGSQTGRQGSEPVGGATTLAQMRPKGGVGSEGRSR